MTPERSPSGNRRTLSACVLLAAGLVLVAGSCAKSERPEASPTSPAPAATSAVEQSQAEAPTVTVYDPDDEDDVPDPRYIRQAECDSGVALAWFQGLLDVGEATSDTEWGAVTRALGGSGDEASIDASSFAPSPIGNVPGNVWTVVSDSGNVLAVVQTFKAVDVDGWGTRQAAVCAEVS